MKKLLIRVWRFFRRQDLIDQLQRKIDIIKVERANGTPDKNIIDGFLND